VEAGALIMLSTHLGVKVHRARPIFLRGWLLLGLVLPLISASGWAATHQVQIVDFSFVPENLVIAPGDTVVWQAAAADHTVLADDGSFDSSPPPASATMTIGQTFSHTFPAVGVFHYYCLIHGQPQAATARVVGKSEPDSSMTGIIRVTDPSVNTAPVTPLNSSPAAAATGISSSPLLQATAFSDADVDDKHGASQWIVRLAATSEVVLDTGVDTANLIKLQVSGLLSSTAYAWQVRYQDDRGEWSAYSLPTQFSVAEAIGAGTGLKGTYFAYNPKLDLITAQMATRVDPTLDFNWGLGKSHPMAPANNFFIYWEGAVVPEFSETYRFRIKADGGVRLWVNGKVIIDDPVATTFAVFRSGTAALEAGIPAVIRLQYFDTLGAASMQLRWSSPSRTFQEENFFA
jgi:plastocyanin